MPLMAQTKMKRRATARRNRNSVQHARRNHSMRAGGKSLYQPVDLSPRVPSVKSFPRSSRHDRPQLQFDRAWIVARYEWSSQHEIVPSRFSHPFPCQSTELGRITVFDSRDRDGHFVETLLDLMRKREKRCAYADGHGARSRVHEDLEAPTRHAGTPCIVQGRQDCPAMMRNTICASKGKDDD